MHDVDAFLTTVRCQQDDFFDRDRPIVVARAPGCLDLIGGNSDYGGGLALASPLAAAVVVALQPDPEPVIRVRCPATGASEVAIPLAALAPGGLPLEYAQSRAFLAAARSAGLPSPLPDDWPACVAGCWLTLMREEFVQWRGGARVLAATALPAGCSAAAALAAATLRALTAAYGIGLAPRELALHCQVALNRVAGLPWGVTAPAAALCGVADHLLPVRCQPCTPGDPLALPAGLAVWGIVAGPEGDGYARARIGAAIGYRMIAEAADLPVRVAENGYMQVVDGRWRGYLANIGPAEYRRSYSVLLPARIDGAAFLACYGGSADPTFPVDPAQIYPVRAAATHAIAEHFRARSFAALLAAARDPALADETALLLGELLYQSHADSVACGLTAPGAERLVELVRDAGVAQGLYGARVSGGGNSVVVLGRAEAGAAVAALAERYVAATGETAQVLSGSSPGAVAYGTRQVNEHSR